LERFEAGVETMGLEPTQQDVEMAKYDPLFRHLVNAGSEPVEMTFTEIGTLVGGLPESARRHSAWWSNDLDGRHVQAKAWLEAGREIEAVDRHGGRVRFSAPHWRRGS
jgi:hypothetical protein